MVLRTQFGYNPFISCLCPTIVFFTVYHLMSISWFLIGRIGLNFYRIGWIRHSCHIFPLSSTVDHHNLNFSSRLQQKSSGGVKSELIFVTFDSSFHDYEVHWKVLKCSSIRSIVWGSIGAKKVAKGCPGHPTKEQNWVNKEQNWGIIVKLCVHFCVCVSVCPKV